MSAIVERPPRKHAPDPDAPIPNRNVSSMTLVIERARAVVRAWQDGDEVEVRAELHELASEAVLLAQADPLPLPGLLHARQRIAVERERTPRSGTS